MFSFVHAADIHLDSPLQGLSRYEGAPVEELRGASRQAFSQLIDYVIDENIPLLVIAGDLYDGDWQDFHTGLFLVKQMARLRDHNVRVALLHGNHDAANVMTRSLPLPDNVYVFPAKRPSTWDLPDLGVVIHGQSYASRSVQDNLAAGYPTPIKGMFNIGMLHTALNGREGYDCYAPCTLDELRARGYNYWALGHVHEYEVPSEWPHVVFPGCIQGRHVRETGIKGCVRVDVDGGGNTTIRHVPLAVLNWEILRLDITGASDMNLVLSSFIELLKDAVDRNDNKPLACRVEMIGTCTAHDELIADPEATRSMLLAAATGATGGRAWVEKVQVRTSPAVDLEEMRRSETPQGDLLRYLDLLATDTRAFEELALDLTDVASKLAGTGVMMPDIGEDAMRSDLLDEVRDLLLPLLSAKRG